MAGSSHFEPYVKVIGLEFTSILSSEQIQRPAEDASLWESSNVWRLGMKQVLAPAMRSTFELICERARRHSFVVLARPRNFGARIAAEKLGTPLCTVYMSPEAFNACDPSSLASQWRGFSGDEVFGPGINAYRRELGMRPVSNICEQWIGSSWDTSAGKFQGGGGGGNSVYFPQPPYQKSVVPDSLATAATGKVNREEPDVSMLADPLTGLTVGQTTGKVTATTASDGGVNFTMTGGKYSEEAVGGTSLASPLFSGMEALAIQGAGSPLGFANPVLYHLNGTPQFHDVVPNPVGGHEPSFLAQNDSGTLLLVSLNKDSSLKTAKGYDDVTGLGSPTGSFLTWFKGHPNGT